MARPGYGQRRHQRLTALIAAGDPATVTEPVVTDVLAGARGDQRKSDLRRLLLRFDVVADFTGAMRIYCRCRPAGVTPRGMIRLHDRGPGICAGEPLCFPMIPIWIAWQRSPGLSWTECCSAQRDSITSSWHAWSWRCTYLARDRAASVPSPQPRQPVGRS
jgi:hypothetical protein